MRIEAEDFDQERAGIRTRIFALMRQHANPAVRKAWGAGENPQGSLFGSTAGAILNGIEIAFALETADDLRRYLTTYIGDTLIPGGIRGELAEQFRANILTFVQNNDNNPDRVSLAQDIAQFEFICGVGPMLPIQDIGIEDRLRAVSAFTLIAAKSLVRDRRVSTRTTPTGSPPPPLAPQKRRPLPF